MEVRITKEDRAWHQKVIQWRSGGRFVNARLYVTETVSRLFFLCHSASFLTRGGLAGLPPTRLDEAISLKRTPSIQASCGEMKPYYREVRFTEHILHPEALHWAAPS